MAFAPLLVGLESTELSAAERKLIQNARPAGYLLLAHNLEEAAQIRSLTDSLRKLHLDIDPIIAIEETGGISSHLGRLIHPIRSSSELGKDGNPRTIAEHGVSTGALLSMLGINLNLAPVLDPESGSDHDQNRWHSDHQRVIDHAGMWNRWMRKRGVRSAGKHFPAGAHPNGSEVTLEQLLKNEWIPYTALMPELDAIVLGHQHFPSLDPENPAALSRRIVTRLLRDQLGFDRHLAIVDDISAGFAASGFPGGAAVSMALHAGNDLVIHARDRTAIEQSLGRVNELPTTTLHDAELRVEHFRKRLPAPTQWSPDRWTSECEKLPCSERQD